VLKALRKTFRGVPYCGRDGAFFPAGLAYLEMGAAGCQRTGTGYPLPRYVCSPLHGVMNASVVALGVLLAGGVLLTARCWGSSTASRGARSLHVGTADTSTGTIAFYLACGFRRSGTVLGFFSRLVHHGSRWCKMTVWPSVRRASVRALLSPHALPAG
jgi:hypothetical protein